MDIRTAERAHAKGEDIQFARTALAATLEVPALSLRLSFDLQLARCNGTLQKMRQSAMRDRGLGITRGIAYVYRVYGDTSVT